MKTTVQQHIITLGYVLNKKKYRNSLLNELAKFCKITDFFNSVVIFCFLYNLPWGSLITRYQLLENVQALVRQLSYFFNT